MPAFPFEVQAFFYAHHFSLYLLIRLFSGIGYSVGTSDDNASWRTSDGVLQPYLSCVNLLGKFTEDEMRDNMLQEIIRSEIQMNLDGLQEYEDKKMN